MASRAVALVLILVHVIGLATVPVNGLLCYSCASTLSDVNRSCQYDPSSANTTVVECTKKYCVTKRVEYANPEGAVYISRSCQDSPPTLNGSIAYEGFITHYQTCSSDLCNVGDGRNPTSPEANSGNEKCRRVPCEANGRRGVCEGSRSCYLNHGTNIGRCNYKNSVCCMYQYSCDQSSSKYLSYFVNPSQYTPYCRFVVQVTDPYVTQVRLDFKRFSLARPEGGTELDQKAFTCIKNRFTVWSSTAGPGNKIGFESLCGENSGQHIYVPVDASRGGATVELAVEMRDYSLAYWEIGIMQIDCECSYTKEYCAPQGCLQYYPATYGYFESFNLADRLYLGALDYAICFKRSATACGMHYSPDLFQLATDDPTYPYGLKGCAQDPGSYPSYDYLYIPEGRTDDNIYESLFCGSGLSPYNGVTSTGIGYSYVKFKTDMNRNTVLNQEEIGFRIRYNEQGYGCLKKNDSIATNES